MMAVDRVSDLLPASWGLPDGLDDGEQVAHQCQALLCGRLVVPRTGWRCPECGSFMRYGCKRANCPDCGQDCQWIRVANFWGHSCPCTETAQQRRERLRNEEFRLEQQAKEEEEEGRRTQIQRARKLQMVLMDSASDCWENEKKRRCGVTRSDLAEKPPREYCRVCPKFLKE